MNTSTPRSILTGMSVGLVLLVGVWLIPRAGWAPPLIKMGIVNWEKIILQFEEYQTELQDLQQRRQKMLDFIREQNSGQRSNRLQGEINPAQLDPEMRQIYKDTIKQINQSRRESRQKYHRRIQSAIRDEAVQQGFSLVLSENSVLYASKDYTDLTQGVIERLNSSSND